MAMNRLLLILCLFFCVSFSVAQDYQKFIQDISKELTQREKYWRDKTSMTNMSNSEYVHVLYISGQKKVAFTEASACKFEIGYLKLQAERIIDLAKKEMQKSANGTTKNINSLLSTIEQQKRKAVQDIDKMCSCRQEKNPNYKPPMYSSKKNDGESVLQKKSNLSNLDNSYSEYFQNEQSAYRSESIIDKEQDDSNPINYDWVMNNFLSVNQGNTNLEGKLDANLTLGKLSGDIGISNRDITDKEKRLQDILTETSRSLADEDNVERSLEITEDAIDKIASLLEFGNEPASNLSNNYVNVPIIENMTITPADHPMLDVDVKLKLDSEKYERRLEEEKKKREEEQRLFDNIKSHMTNEQYYSLLARLYMENGAKMPTFYQGKDGEFIFKGDKNIFHIKTDKFPFSRVTILKYQSEGKVLNFLLAGYEETKNIRLEQGDDDSFNKLKKYFDAFNDARKDQYFSDENKDLIPGISGGYSNTSILKGGEIIQYNKKLNIETDLEWKDGLVEKSFRANIGIEGNKTVSYSDLKLNIIDGKINLSILEYYVAGEAGIGTPSFVLTNKYGTKELNIAGSGFKKNNEETSAFVLGNGGFIGEGQVGFQGGVDVDMVRINAKLGAKQHDCTDVFRNNPEALINIINIEIEKSQKKYITDSSQYNYSSYSYNPHNYSSTINTTIDTQKKAETERKERLNSLIQIKERIEKEGITDDLFNK